MAGQVPFPRPGGVVGGKYVLEAMLDSDASGAVFRARHSSTGRPFAIRWLTRSSKAGASLPPTAAQNAPPLDDCYQNPTISAPLDLGRTPHGTYIVMEWLNGETLATRIACEGALPLTAAAELLVPCMRALHQLHQVHVVHGDLRPANIFICRGVEPRPETVRVFDYSLAGAEYAPARVDETGEYTRDAHFLAPEQIAGTQVDHRADVYAFGVLLYLCVTGKLPFGDPEQSDDFARWIYSQDPPAVPGAAGLTPPLYKLLARALARDVSERFESCDELASALEELAQHPEQVGASLRPARVIRSARPTMRLASDVPLPLPPTAAELAATVGHVRAIDADGVRSAPAPMIGGQLVPPPTPAPRTSGPLRATMPGASIAPFVIPTAPTRAASLRATMPGSSVFPASMPSEAGAPARAASVTPSALPPVQKKLTSMRATVPGASVIPSPIPARRASIPLRSTPPAARDSRPPLAASRSQRPLAASVPVITVPPPAAGSLVSPRATISHAPTIPMRVMAQAPDRPGAAAAVAADASWPLPIKQGQHQASQRPLRLQSERPAAARFPSSQPQPRLSINESTIPMEVLRQQSYRAPRNRGLAAAGAGLSLVAALSAAAYLSPPRQSRDALSGIDSLSLSAPQPNDPRDSNTVHAAAAALPLPAALPTPVTEPIHSSANVSAPVPANTAPLLDDPSTPIDESDPLIAAALAALQRSKASASRDAQPATAEQPESASEPALEAAAREAVKPSRRPAKVAAAPAPQSPSVRRAPATVQGLEPAYKPLPAAGKMPWEIPAARRK